MKPSGPGLLFAGRFSDYSFDFQVMGLLRFSISSWFSFGKLYLSKNLSIFSPKVVHFIGIELLIVVSYDPLYFVCSLL